MHGRMSSMEERFALYALVVTYNISCVDSQTCQGLSALDQENLHIIVFDNSVSDYGNQSYCQKKGWTYLPKPLRSVAEVRLNSADMSLAEIGEALDPPIGKSGVNHRMKKIQQIAEELMLENGDIDEMK